VIRKGKDLQQIYVNHFFVGWGERGKKRNLSYIKKILLSLNIRLKQKVAVISLWNYTKSTKM